MIRKSLFIVLVMLTLVACQDEMRQYFPQTMAGMELSNYKSGSDAAEEMNRLHGKSIKAEAVAVARYGDGAAEVWISRAKDGREARRQTGKMVHLMFENPKSPFSYMKRFEYEGVPVYPFTGMGKRHLVFFRGDLIYWVTASPEAAEQALADLF